MLKNITVWNIKKIHNVLKFRTIIALKWYDDSIYIIKDLDRTTFLLYFQEDIFQSGTIRSTTYCSEITSIPYKNSNCVIDKCT